MFNLDTYRTEVLIIGSGLAGLLAAHELAAQGKRVVLACKGNLIESNTAMAQGGLACVLPGNTKDSLSRHLEDTVSAGAGLTDELAARLILQEGYLLVNKLQELGARFDTQLDGGFDLAREGGHSQSRVLHFQDTTGRSIAQALAARVLKDKNISVLEKTYAEDFIVSANKVAGAYLRLANERFAVYAPHVICASGGTGQLFSRTTNPWLATGDGIAMAYRAGAECADMEFVQFHPTALSLAGAPAFLISEAVRGAGALLLNKKGERFAGRFHKDAELATRDVVSQAILSVMQEEKSECVYLDLRPIGQSKLEAHFPNILKVLSGYGIDAFTQQVPVAPAAHYFMGGILTGRDGQTTIENLYAIGECASIGLHGANRLASNSLLEAGVMALRVSRHITSQNTKSLNLEKLDSQPESVFEIAPDLNKLQTAMYQYAGPVRHELGLKTLLRELEKGSQTVSIESNQDLVSANMLVVSKLICQAALVRQESRGAHFRLDFPKLDNANFRKRLSVSQTSMRWLEPTIHETGLEPAQASAK